MRRLFEEGAAWVAIGIADVPCESSPTHYVATNQVTRTKPIAILLLGKDTPSRLACDVWADELVRSARTYRSSASSANLASGTLRR